MLVETSTAATNIKAFLGGTLKPSDLGVGGVPKNLKQIVPGAGPMPGVTRPGQSRVSGGAFYIMNTTAPEVQAATWDFMKYMLGVQQQVKWHLQGSYLPAVAGVAADPEGAGLLEDRPRRRHAQGRPTTSSTGPTRSTRVR